MIGADQGDPRAVQRTAGSMHRELGRMGRLVTDLLTLSRLDSTTPMKMAPLDAGLLIAEVAEQMEPVAEGRGVRLVVDRPEPANLQGEHDRLKQVVLNLVDNALRYTPPGGEVRLSARADPARGEVRLEVRDTGQGIAPEDLPHIFDRFYRGDASRARATGNTGLGLAIVRAIVEAHGGRIGAESIMGEGTTFSIVLPAHLPRDGREQIAARKVKHATPAGEQPATGQPA
jgi:two-component system sensor histidine kinase ResE